MIICHVCIQTTDSSRIIEEDLVHVVCFLSGGVRYLLNICNLDNFDSLKMAPHR